METPTDGENFKSLQTLKYKLHEVEKKLIALVKTFDWDYNKMIEKDDLNMVTCSINSQHRVPQNKMELHKESCSLRSQGYNESDKIFPEYSGAGSCISLTSQLIDSITKNLPSAIENRTSRPVPQSSANFDQNFNREEKLAIYDYIIANTKKQKTFSDLCGQVSEKKEEKKEMTVWEIAAAQRNAKRRRASYRNKVHTNRKTHTQILREVIEGQMEMLKEESTNEKSNEESKMTVTDWKKSCVENSCPDEDKRNLDRSGSKRKNNHTWDKSHSNKRLTRYCRDDSSSRPRSCDKYRKWKTGEGRSHFHKSSG